MKLEKNLLEFLEENFSDKKHFDAVKRYFNKTKYTVKDLILTDGIDLLRARDLGLKSYIKICDDLKKLGLSTKSPVFNYVEKAKKIIEKQSKRVSLNEYLTPRRISSLNKKLDELKEKGVGYVEDINIFNEKIEDIRKMIIS